MKKKLRKISVFLSIVLCLSLIQPAFSYEIAAVATADAATTTTILDAATSSASTGCTMLGVEGSFYTNAKEALDYINQIRKEACDAGNVPNPNNPSKYLTSSDYVEIKWSTALESIARIRSSEASMTIGHYRLNGADTIWGISYGGISSSGECLAWNNSYDMKYGITQWYDEKTDWLAQNTDEVTGHYEMLINPNYKYIGLGNFYNPAAPYSYTLAGAFSYSCGSLGSTPLSGYNDIIQKVDVSNDYITYLIDGGDEIGANESRQYKLKAKITYVNADYEKEEDGTFISTIDVLDDVTFASSDSSIATVDSSGIVTGVSAGTATITASIGGVQKAALSVTVGCKHEYEYSTSFWGDSVTKTCKLCGDSSSFTYAIYWNTASSGSFSSSASSYISGKQPGDVVYAWPQYTVDGTEVKYNAIGTSTDTDVVSVFNDGKMKEVSFNGNGIAILTFAPEEEPKLEVSYTIRVGSTGSVNIGSASVTLAQDTYTYSGSAYTPAPTVTFDGVTLTKGTDYTVSYANNTDAGDATVTITGAGIFTGSVTKTFHILDASSTTETTTEASTEATTKTTTEAHTHSYTEKVTKAATCTEKGVKTYTCSCGESYTEDIPATGHTVVTDAAVAPTCTKTGLTEGSHCSVCNIVLTAQKEVAATGHTIVTDAAVSPTCTKTGLTEGSHCSVCNIVLTAQKEVAATGHTYTSEITKEATTTDEGVRTYTCSSCKDTYTEAISKLPSEDHKHSYIEKVTKAATCTEDGVKTYTCSCGDTYTESIPATGHTVVTDAAVSPTCTKTGLTEGSHCSVCNTVFTVQKEVAATGHTIVTDAAVSPTCTKTGLTESSHCSVCNIVLTAQKEVAATGHTIVTDAAVSPTCTKTGLTEGSHCSVCNTVLTAQKEVAATGHTTVTDTAVSPTCTKTGLTEGSHCSVCGEVIKAQEKVKANGHTVVTDAAVSPTCTKAGLTKGSHCSVCEKVITKQEVVNATGHTYTSKVTKKATTTNEGVRTYTCSTCGDTYTEAIDKLPSETTVKKLTPVKKGTTLKSSKANASFKVTKAGKVSKGKITGAEVAYVKPLKKKSSVTIPASVTINGVTYKVTSINANAFKNNTKLKSVSIGANITKIGSKAFYGCKNLKKITIKSTKLTSIGKKAITGIYKKATIQLSKKYFKKYKKYFKSSVGYKKTMVLKKF